MYLAVRMEVLQHSVSGEARPSSLVSLKFSTLPMSRWTSHSQTEIVSVRQFFWLTIQCRSKYTVLLGQLDFWNVHGIMNTSGRLQSMWGFTLTLQETLSIHESMNIWKIKFIAYIYI